MKGPPISDPMTLVRIASEKKIPEFEVTKDWSKYTVFVIGNGTSLLDIDLSVLDRPDFKVMMANDGYKLYPKSDVLMCSDRHWLADNSHDMSDFEGETIIVTRPEAVVKVDSRMRFMRRAYIERFRGDPLSNKNVLVEGHTSTSTNISLAVHRGAKKIVLLGIDLKPGSKGRRRAVGDRVDDEAKAQMRYNKQIKHLTIQAAFVRARGIKVLNCSPHSKLACYPYAKLRDVL